MSHWRNLLVVVWGSDTSVSMIDEYGKLIAHVSGRYAKFAVVHVAMMSRPLPNADERAAFATLGNQFANQMSHCAVLIVGGGFWASAVRSLITSMQVLIQRRLQIKLCSSIEEVTSWLAADYSVESDDVMAAAETRLVFDWLLDQPQLRAFRGVLV